MDYLLLEGGRHIGPFENFTGSVERIEIVKGASSSLYGSEALGVLNNITTKGKYEGFEKVYYQYGSYNTQDILADIS